MHARAGVLLTAQGFLQPADLHGCSVRRESHIVEVGYRRGRQQSDERQKNRRIRLDSSVVHGLLWSLLSVESRGRVATVVGTIWWVSWANGKISQSSTADYLSGCSLKTQSHQPPHSGANYACGCIRKIKATFRWHVNCKIKWAKKGLCWSLTRRYKETFPCILLLMCLTVTNPECCWRNQHTCQTLQIKQVYMHIWCIFQSELVFLCWESPILQQKKHVYLLLQSTTDFQTQAVWVCLPSVW